MAEVASLLSQEMRMAMPDLLSSISRLKEAVPSFGSKVRCLGAPSKGLIPIMFAQVRNAPMDLDQA